MGVAVSSRRVVFPCWWCPPSARGTHDRTHTRTTPLPGNYVHNILRAAPASEAALFRESAMVKKSVG